MLSNKQLTRLKRSSYPMARDGIAEALAMKPLLIPIIYDFGVQGGGTQEVTTITCVADVSDSLDGTSFLIYDEAGSVGVWIDTDNSGTTIPTGANAADRAIEVTGVVTNDTAADVATAVATAINGDSKFTATANAGVITVTCVDPEAVTNAADAAGAEATGFTFAVTTEGISNINIGEAATETYTFKEAAIVTRVLSYELTNVTSGGSATVALNAGTTNLVAATAIASFTGVVSHTLAGSAAGIVVAANDTINVDVEVTTLTAGKVLFLIEAMPVRQI